MEEMIGNPKYITDVKANNLPDDSAPINPANLVPNNGGVDFPIKNPELKVVLTPGNEKLIFKIEFPNPNDNLEKVDITLIPLDSSKSPEVINNADANKPIYPSSAEPVKEIIIKVVSTIENKNAENVEISIQSCSFETTIETTTGTGSTTTTPTTTTGTGSTTTTETTTTGTGSTTTTPTTTTTTGTGSTTTTPTTTTTTGTGSTTTTSPTTTTPPTTTSTVFTTTITGTFYFYFKNQFCSKFKSNNFE